MRTLYREYVFLLLISLAALAIRILVMLNKPLWYDELQSVTYSILPIQDLLKSVQIFEPHPPVYYIQLYFWMLVRSSDRWIKLNSAVWSLLTLLMVYFIGKKLYNSRVALLGSLIFALLPLAIIYGQEARMYSMLMFFGVCSLYFLRLFFERQTWVNGLATIIFTLAFLLSHGAGFMILVSLSTYTLFVLWDESFRSTRLIQKLSAMLLVVLVIYIPWLLMAESISKAHILFPNFSDFINTLFILLAGYAENAAWIKWCMVILYLLGAIFLALYDKCSRSLVIAFILVPIVFSLIISIIFRPIWSYRTLVYLVPFWSLIIAYMIIRIQKLFSSRTARYFAQGSLAIAVIAMIVHSILLMENRSIYPWHIKEASQFLKSNVQEGDIIFIPDQRLFWGTSWYLINQGSINPLTTDYSIKTDDGIKVLSEPAFIEPKTNTTYWVMYRSIDNLDPFKELISDDYVWDFDDMHVGKVEILD